MSGMHYGGRGKGVFLFVFFFFRILGHRTVKVLYIYIYLELYCRVCACGAKRTGAERRLGGGHVPRQRLPIRAPRVVGWTAARPISAWLYGKLLARWPHVRVTILPIPHSLFFPFALFSLTPIAVLRNYPSLVVLFSFPFLPRPTPPRFFFLYFCGISVFLCVCVLPRVISYAPCVHCFMVYRTTGTL